MRLRRGALWRASTWSIIEGLCAPALNFIAAPFLLKALGLEEFGRYTFSLAVVSLGGLANLGTSQAAVLFVSQAIRDEKAIDLPVRTSLAMAVISIPLIALISFILAAVVALGILDKVGPRGQMLMLTFTASYVAWLQVLEQAIGGCLKGGEAYRANSMYELLERTGCVAVAASVAFITNSATCSLSAYAVVSSIGAGIRLKGLSHHLGVDVTPRFDSFNLRAFFDVSRWSWAQSISATVFNSLDRILVGSILGADMLAVYAIATQLGNLVLLLNSAIFQPIYSRRARLSSDNAEAIQALTIRAIGFNIAFVVTITIGMYFGVHALLSGWLGYGFANSFASITRTQVLAFSLTALATAAYFLLLGAGKQRGVAMLNAMGGLVMLAAISWLVPLWGLTGAAIARALYGICVLPMLPMAILAQRCNGN